MSVPALTLVILAIAGLAWQLGRRRALAVAGGPAKAPSLHSRPVYFGALTALWCAIPALLLLGLWAVLRGSVVTELVVADLPPELRDLPANELALVVNDIRNQVEGNFVRDDVSPVIVETAERYRSFEGLGQLVSTVAVPLVALLGLALAWRRISPRVRARNHVEGAILVFIVASSTVAILTTAGIVLSVLFEAFRFFQSVPLFDFLFGVEWSPQTAIRPDQVGASGAFGMVPLFTGTLLISAVAMLVAVPVGLMSAIYLGGVREPPAALHREAPPRDPRRYPDRGVRLLRGPRGRPRDSRCGLRPRARGRLAERARGGARHGGDDHPPSSRRSPTT